MTRTVTETGRKAIDEKVPRFGMNLRLCTHKMYSDLKFQIAIE